MLLKMEPFSPRVRKGRLREVLTGEPSLTGLGLRTGPTCSLVLRGETRLLQRRKRQVVTRR